MRGETRPHFSGKRISVVGTTGSGKTTVAGEIAARLGIPHIEIDALHWEADWTGAPDEVLRERLLKAIAGDRWVVDGNYSRMRPLVWSRADTVVYVDYSFWRTFWQLLQRTIRRSITREELWAGNRESLCTAFFSRDSILLWMLKTFWRRRSEYPRLFAREEYAHLQVVHLKSPRVTRAWLEKLPGGEGFSI